MEDLLSPSDSTVVQELVANVKGEVACGFCGARGSLVLRPDFKADNAATQILLMGKWSFDVEQKTAKISAAEVAV